jgi:hypothetical protein
MKLIVVFVFLGLVARSIAQDYWQQEVNYRIQVSLDDERHMLNGYVEIEYTNNSPESLPFIYFHLWPNAYSNGETALAKQQYQDGEDILQNISEVDRGFIDSLDFTISGTKLSWEFDPEHTDIARVKLLKPLMPGQKTMISTPFRVKLPSGEISRLGHIGQSYQITQWYPKPAVFDQEGWHPMPYLNQGEFYSEYGSFDVEITLPSNYVVGSTGDLQTASELSFLEKKVEITTEHLKKVQAPKNGRGAPTPFPASSDTLKTIRYVQSNVHDFAWFADKRYEVLRGQVGMPHSKKLVTTWAMFVPNNAYYWKDAIEYLNDGTYYYSLWNGDYPYNQVTAVDGTISAGGGMEYPNVTVIGNAGSALELEIVIIHEVGHNWFYGILGSNERVHGWMDEGLNTLNEVRYIQTKYPENTYLANMVADGKFNFHGLCYHDFNDVTTRSVAALGIDQPVETHSAEFRSINYGVIMYQKTGLIFDYLRYYLGDELFDHSMRTYYDDWKFKHPQPKDIQASIEKASGKDLCWVFNDLIQTTQQADYKIQRVKRKDGKASVKLKNVGNVSGPIPVSAVQDTSVVETLWLDPNVSSGWVHFSCEYQRFQIDPLRQIPESNRSNNTWDKSWLLNKTEPFKPRMLFGYDRADESNHFILPALGGNTYDKFMIGAAFHNYGLSFQPFRYFIAPMYSFGRNNVSGVGEFSYVFYPKGKIKQTQLGLSVKSFKDDNTFARNDSYFAVASPYISILWSNEQKRNPIEHKFTLQELMKRTRRGPISIDEVGAFMLYSLSYKERDHLYNLHTRNDFVRNITNDDQMGRLSFEGTYKWRYHKKKYSRWLETRLFAGYNYLFQTSTAGNAYRYGMALGGADGFQDLFAEDYFLDRSATGGIFEHQRRENMGGFKTTSGFGTTEAWLLTANLYWELPIKVKGLGAFVDLGGFQQNGVAYGVYNAGLGWRLGDTFGVYFPLIQSENLVNAYTSLNYLERVRFTLNINIVNTGKLRDVLMR